MGKRGAAPTSPMKKKLKKSHPVNVNLDKVEAALYDHSVDVPGSKVTRKMLITAVPKALGDGAAVEERHASQKVIVDAIGEIFSAEVSKWTEKSAAAQAELEAANVDKASKDAVLELKQKALEAKKADIDAKKEAHSANKTALKDAEKALHDATSAVEHHDANIKKTEDTKVKYETALNVTLASLVKSEYATPKDKKAAEGKALQKEPEKRGNFDTTVIGEVEKRMTTHIAKLTSELAQGPASKEKKVAEAEAATKKKESCVAAQEASAEALKAAEAEKPDLDAAVKAATHEEKEKAKVVEKITSSKVEPAKEGLDGAKESYEAWKYLAERPMEVEEEVPPEPEEEAKDVSMEAENA